MASPILYNINAFDASMDHVFAFSWSGKQMIKCQAIIRNNTTDEVVYGGEIVQDTMKTQYTLHAGAIANSVTPYNISIRVFYKSDDGSSDVASDYSSPLVFYCFDTPVFSVNMSAGQVVQNSNYMVTLTYGQSQGELLNSFQFTLYDEQRGIVKQSSMIYDTDQVDWPIDNLEDEKYYFLRATGETINGMTLDTGYIEFSVTYIYPLSFSSIEVTNRRNYADIRIESNLISIDGDPVGDWSYTQDGTSIDLTQDGASVTFDQGYSIVGDFRLFLEFNHFTVNKTIVRIQNGLYEMDCFIALSTINGKEVYYAVLRVNNDLVTYVVESDYIEKTSAVSPASDFRLTITRKGPYYDVALSTV